MHEADIEAVVPQGLIHSSACLASAQKLPTQRRLRCRTEVEAGVHRGTLGSLERHYTADEMRVRSETAENITSEELRKVQVILPLSAMPPDARKKAWAAAAAAAKKRHLALGVAGNPVFCQLPYFRCAVVPTVQVTLPGVESAATLSLQM